MLKCTTDNGSRVWIWAHHQNKQNHIVEIKSVHIDCDFKASSLIIIICLISLMAEKQPQQKVLQKQPQLLKYIFA